MGKYDKGKGWDLVAALEVEKEHFRKLHEALQMKSEMDKYAGTDSEQVEDEIELLLNTIPPQVQQVWDNLNLRTKHRFQRERDEYAKNNFDWMASIFIKDRIDVNHLDIGEPLKNFDDIKIESTHISHTEVVQLLINLMELELIVMPNNLIL